jgi:hypothetical protein
MCVGGSPYIRLWRPLCTKNDRQKNVRQQIDLQQIKRQKIDRQKIVQQKFVWKKIVRNKRGTNVSRTKVSRTTLSRTTVSRTKCVEPFLLHFLLVAFFTLICFQGLILVSLKKEVEGVKHLKIHRRTLQAQNCERWHFS